jgi:DASS family divalent anion:Na+ symporter
VSALFPLSMALMMAAGVPGFTAAIALGAFSSINGGLTQYGIGSGPVMYGSGYVTQHEWWKAGFIMSLVYMVVWLVVGPAWWKLLGHI